MTSNNDTGDNSGGLFDAVRKLQITNQNFTRSQKKLLPPNPELIAGLSAKSDNHDKQIYILGAGLVALLAICLSAFMYFNDKIDKKFEYLNDRTDRFLEIARTAATSNASSPPVIIIKNSEVQTHKSE